ncbi:MAG: hypothetical protein RL653_3142 [Pseudomonadota bacterium]|jgi:hypothetical protein
MSSDALQPFSYPVDLRLPFLGGEALLRLANTCGWVQGQSAWVLGAGPGHLGLALELAGLGLAVTVADTDEARLERFKVAAGSSGAPGDLALHRLEKGPTALPEASADALFVDARFLQPLERLSAQLRPALRRNGHLVAVCTSRVGRAPASAALGEHWERRTGSALRPPRELLQRLERTGYEPQSAESLADDGMEDAYALLEAALPLLDAPARVPFDEELKTWRTAGDGTAAVAFSVLVARRKEPGEKPPAVRTAG